MDQIEISYASGNEHLLHNGAAHELTLLDFWRWAFSDYISNTTRGVLAEFLVAAALGLDLKIPRGDWAKYDFEYRGVGIEIKSSSYHQRWYQKRMSAISFPVPPTQGWDPATGLWSKEVRRQADVYVFCLLAEKDRAKINPLDLDQWRFWVIPTSSLDKQLGGQERVGESRLLKEFGAPLPYADIKQAVDLILDNLKRIGNEPKTG